MNEAALENGNADCGATQPASISDEKISSTNSLNNNCSGGISQGNPAEMPTMSWAELAVFFSPAEIAARAANDDSPPVERPEMTWDELMAFFAPREVEIVDFQMIKFVKDGGPLSKVISRNSDGEVVADGSACRMTRGVAFRIWLTGFTGLANFIDNLQSNEAAALGPLPEDRGDRTEITSEKQLNQLNFANAISRTKRFFQFERGVPAAFMLDHDMKGMPPEVRARLQEMAKTLSKAEQKRFGEKAGFIAAVRSLIEGFDDLGYVLRDSTSGGLYIPATDTTPKWESPGKASCHLYLIIRDGADAYRAIRALQDRAWLAGFGWHWISKGGHLLKRSIVDITVASPERLIFEGQPIIKPPLAKYPRKSEVREGCLLDTLTIRNLDTSENAALEKLLQASAAALGKELKAVRARVIEDRVKEAVAKGADEERARKAFSRMFDGEQITLYPDVVLHFDNPELGAVSVGDALFDPKRYEEEVLADPIEPCGEGEFLLTNKAFFFLGSDHGDPLIYSNLHGGQLYRLRWDFDSMNERIEAIDKKKDCARVAPLLAEMLTTGGADLPVTEDECELLFLAAKRKTELGVTVIRKAWEKAKGKRNRDRTAKDEETDRPTDEACEKFQKFLVDPRDYTLTAGYFRQFQHTDEEGRPTLFYSEKFFYAFNGRFYDQLTDVEKINGDIWMFMRNRCEVQTTDAKGNITIEPYYPNVGTQANLVAATKALVQRDMPEDPSWLDGRDDPDVNHQLPVANGLLNMRAQVLTPPTPAYYTLSGLSYGYDPAAPCPAWDEFTASVWGDDRESIDAVEEIFGYCLTHDTSHQKIFGFYGPSRSGKGTTMRVLEGLTESVASKSLEELVKDFPLESMIGKKVILYPDLRVGLKPNDAEAAIAVMLRIAGADRFDIRRKYISSYGTTLTGKQVFGANKPLPLADGTKSFVARLFAVAYPKSFEGQEDRGWDARLKAERPGILNRALAGYGRLLNRGCFVQPKSGLVYLRAQAEKSDPNMQFLNELCILDPKAMISKDDLYSAYNDFALSTAVPKPLTYKNFHSDFLINHQVTVIRPRVKEFELDGNLDPKNPEKPDVAGEKRPRMFKGIALRRDWRDVLHEMTPPEKRSGGGYDPGFDVF